MIIFGGCSEQGPLNDVAIFDVHQHKWLEMSIKGTPPAERYGHCAGVVGDALHVFGGMIGATIAHTLNTLGGDGQEHFGDVHVLQLNTMTWEEAICDGDAPQSRSGHSCVCVQTEELGSQWRALVIFGGHNGEYYFNDMHRLHVRVAEASNINIVDIEQSARIRRYAHMNLTNTRSYYCHSQTLMPLSRDGPRRSVSEEPTIQEKRRSIQDTLNIERASVPVSAAAGVAFDPKAALARLRPASLRPAPQPPPKITASSERPQTVSGPITVPDLPPANAPTPKRPTTLQLQPLKPAPPPPIPPKPPITPKTQTPKTPSTASSTPPASTGPSPVSNIARRFSAGM